MAAELIAGTLHFGLVPIDPERSEQPRAGIAGQLFQVTTKGRAALVMCKICHRYPRGNYAKPLVEGSKLTEKCLQGRFP